MRKLGEKICKKCGIIFKQGYNISKKEWDSVLYCSHSCANSLNMKGRIVKESTKEKLRNANLGHYGLKGKNNKRYTRVEKECIECGNIYIVKNYRKEESQFCSKKCAYKNRDMGISTENQIIRHSKEYRDWRKICFDRDNFTCQCCGQLGGKLRIHHINNFSEFPELRFEIGNGITVCEECHNDFHKQYGYRNNTPGQLEEYLAVGQEA